MMNKTKQAISSRIRIIKIMTQTNSFSRETFNEIQFQQESVP